MPFFHPARMELSCVRTGEWRIEGFDVERTKVDGKIWWKVSKQYAGEPRRLIGEASTLTEACDVIDDEIYRQHSGEPREP